METQELTTNIKAVNNDLEVLAKYFPHCFDKNGDFNFDKFRKELTVQEINFSKESYGMDWLGKSYARLIATDNATTLLKEDTEWNSRVENKNSENILIKGDNLEVLKHLSNAYYEKIKMIYIDPPYNTGGDDFVYEDSRNFSVEEFSRLAGVDEDTSKKILSFVNSKSNSHSAWLTFMYPRLYIAKQLLRDDGVIFISIDDNEVAQLRLMMDEIFGEENYIAIAPRKTGAGSAATNSESELRKLNDYVLIYQKNRVVFNKKIAGVHIYPYTDETGDYKLAQFQASGSDAYRVDRPNMYYPIYELQNGTLTTQYSESAVKTILPRQINGQDGRWIWKANTFETDISSIHYENNVISRKIYYDPSKDQTKYQVEKAWFDEFSNSIGTTSFNKLFEPFKGLFSHPKPIELIKFLISLVNTKVNEKEIVILDFFAGSGTTGDAVMKLNAEDGGYRKYILVQLPEIIDQKKNQSAFNFVKDELGVEVPTIFDITKERLIRAANKIKSEINQDESLLPEDRELDLGFKIFETRPIWDDYEIESLEFQDNLILPNENNFDEEDIKMLLTTWKTYDGIPLTIDLEKIDLEGYIGYFGANKLYLMNTGFCTDNLKVLLEKIDSDPTFSPSSIFVFGYNFDSKTLREISENVKHYKNKKNTDIDFVIRF